MTILLCLCVCVCLVMCDKCAYSCVHLCVHVQMCVCTHAHMYVLYMWRPEADISALLSCQFRGKTVLSLDLMNLAMIMGH